MKRPWAPLEQSMLFSLPLALTACPAYAIGSHITGWFHAPSAEIGGLWSAISGIVVFQASPKASISSASLRVVGTAIGAIFCAIYLYFFEFTLYGFGLTILLTAWVCQMTNIPDHARLACITVAVIMVTEASNPDLDSTLNASLRFGESCIGTALAIFFSYLRGLVKGHPG
ncbi:hypothetical protein EVC62_06765 [Salinicola endophyticus]|uniref:Integral membrane bound transporter domain-containing protein n=2 Tax=Salinicola endophyticus TaxID=1949083 RepID=A0ABY8FEZ7_9GAMM|nr:hypothetical protein EVC62_06765 [Salinicola endophyticus]